MKQLLMIMMVLCLGLGMLSGCNKKYGHGFDDPEHDPAQFQNSNQNNSKQ